MSKKVIFNGTNRFALLIVVATLMLLSSTILVHAQAEKSIARLWNEQLLAAIRFDQARPTVHARNLFHTSIAMWDAWSAFDPASKQVIHHEKMQVVNIDRARDEAISYAVYRLLKWRFKKSPNVAQTDTALDRLMNELDYDILDTDTKGNTATALGNRIAKSIIEYGLSDGSNEQNDYSNRFYKPINPRLDPGSKGNPAIVDPNRWQQLDLPNFVGQSGLPEENYPAFVGPEWGEVKPFALTDADVDLYQRDGYSYRVYMDPGQPPVIGDDPEKSELFKSGFEQVIEWSGKLDPGDGEIIDISPESRGNNTLGTNDGNGHHINPVTGMPYQPQLVRAGDYYRVLAEFWADGPSSETPPGHWFVLLNFVSDQESLVKTFSDGERVFSDLEWDVHAYLALGGAMHDAAIAAWSTKGWYDYARPISAIRYLCDQGQSTDPGLPNYNLDGINLKPGVIELITSESIQPGGIHHHLATDGESILAQIAVRAWRGPDYVKDANLDTAGVGWILCGDWWPYQRPNFVTPPFAGYVSGHSTYSRAAAEVLTLITGSKFFPGGKAFFRVPKDDYLVFEKGPSRPLQLQWATYQDAADECSLSRIYGGIHPPGDDIPGRFMGYKIGHRAFGEALTYFAL